MNNDPYASPVTDPYGTTYASNGAVSAAAVKQLEGTKPWVRFIAVMVFIGSGFMLLAAAGMLIAGLAGASLGARGGVGGLSAGMGMGIAVIYGALAFLYIYPGVKLWKFANAIAALLRSGSEADLVEALNQQRAFWRFTGIVMLVLLSLYALVIIGAILVGGIAAFKMGH